MHGIFNSGCTVCETAKALEILYWSFEEKPADIKALLLQDTDGIADVFLTIMFYSDDRSGYRKLSAHLILYYLGHVHYDRFKEGTQQRFHTLDYNSWPSANRIGKAK